MKKNAILALIMAASMTIAMTSCGKTDEEVSSGTEQPSYNEAMGIDGAVTEAEKAIIEPVKEILDSDLSSNKIQLGNHVFTLPVKLEDILNSGATVTNDSDPVNDIIKDLGSYCVEFNLDGFNYLLPFKNTNFKGSTYYPVQLKDCFNFSDISDDNNNVIFPKGIRTGSTVDEMKTYWGEPTTDNLDECAYALDGISYYVSIDFEKKIITKIKYNMSYDEYTQAIINATESKAEHNEESIETSTTEE